MKNAWLIIGFGPSGASAFEAAMRRDDIAVSATTNSGWQLLFTAPKVIVPDYYWATDAVLLPCNCRAMRAMQGHGTKIVSTPGAAPMVEQLSGVKPDILLDMNGKPEIKPFEPGSYVQPFCSGAILMQFAVNSGAKKVIMTGFDGYQSSEQGQHFDTLDRRLGTHKGKDQTRNYIAPLVRSVIEKCPEVQFEFYGQPSLLLEGVDAPNCVMHRTGNDIPILA